MNYIIKMDLKNNKFHKDDFKNFIKSSKPNVLKNTKIKVLNMLFVLRKKIQ